jgi:hypothetical protein
VERFLRFLRFVIYDFYSFLAEGRSVAKGALRAVPTNSNLKRKITAALCASYGRSTTITTIGHRRMPLAAIGCGRTSEPAARCPEVADRAIDGLS